jgi:RNA polymerase sigma-70 factor (ECF subfamily)
VDQRPDDRSLVARARQGDTSAFDLLVRRHAGPVYRIALRILGDRAAAEDAAQEAFITAWRRIADIRAGQAFAAWLFRIVTNRAIDAAHRRRPDLPADYGISPPSRAAGPEEYALAAGLQAALVAALGQLTPPQRACWVLKELEGLSYEQIADITQTSPDAVRGRIHRARSRLAEELAAWR